MYYAHMADSVAPKFRKNRKKRNISKKHAKPTRLRKSSKNQLNICVLYSWQSQDFQKNVEKDINFNFSHKLTLFVVFILFKKPQGPPEGPFRAVKSQKHYKSNEICMFFKAI